ncbi:hypothetical protein TDB9533_00362 [Thalassocella blandensis]|nr:hypothetical protein TDB9533_00362 [Thalassocella blandensis]
MRLRFYIKYITTLLGGCLTSIAALAHPGHDHSDPSSYAIHAVFAFTILALFILATFLLLRHHNAKKQRQHEEE